MTELLDMTTADELLHRMTALYPSSDPSVLAFIVLMAHDVDIEVLKDIVDIHERKRAEQPSSGHRMARVFLD